MRMSPGPRAIQAYNPPSTHPDSRKREEITELRLAKLANTYAATRAWRCPGCGAKLKIVKCLACHIERSNNG